MPFSARGGLFEQVQHLALGYRRARPQGHAMIPEAVEQVRDW